MGAKAVGVNKVTDQTTLADNVKDTKGLERYSATNMADVPDRRTERAKAVIHRTERLMGRRLQPEARYNNSWTNEKKSLVEYGAILAAKNHGDIEEAAKDLKRGIETGRLEAMDDHRTEFAIEDFLPKDEGSAP